jgi:uncharacterized integral membrane protein (TIGR00698 family)
MSSQPRLALVSITATFQGWAPGLALAATVAALAWLAERLAAFAFTLPAIVAALLIGMALHRIAVRPAFGAGLALCVKTILRWAVALLGLRVSLGEIISLGATTATLVVGAMLVTVVLGLALAALMRMPPGFGALAGAATAVCGASATLATATVVPAYPDKERDVVYIVLMVNALSTVAMLAYPPLAAWLGLDAQEIGILLGATIHDVAQVVGAGFSVSAEVGNTSVIVKLFRVFLLLPVVLGVGYWLAGRSTQLGSAQVPIPGFAIAFLVLCVLNSTIPAAPALVPAYTFVKEWLLLASYWGLLLAIAALGLGTSIVALRGVSWRHLTMLTTTTLAILLVVLLALRWLAGGAT